MVNLMHLSREEAEAIRALDNQASASEITDVRQLQGRINELDDLLYLPNRAERVVNPHG